ncbi:MAG TPA: carbonic anhydrase [Ktedonobacterales bacterium]|nr:carbonic anhydrase [Ktedonobacterales bacterium]
MAQGTFGTAINCIDGRAQEPVAAWVRANAQADFVDTVTVPGADNALTHMTPDRLAQMREMVAISVNAHGSQIVAIAGHFGCAAFPAERAEHEVAIRNAVSVVKGWGLPVRVVGLWVNDQWQVEVVE